MNFREKNGVQLLEPDPRLLDVGGEKKRSQRVGIF